MDSILHFSKRLAKRPMPGMISGIGLRHFLGPQDIPVWLELRHRAFARAKPGIQSWGPAEFTAEFLDKPWWSPERIWFAFVNAAGDTSTSGNEPAVIGTVGLADRGSGPEAVRAVHWLAVLPTWRGRGVGRLLIETLEETCWQQGHRTIVLETHAGWTAARRLYESLAYQLTPGAIAMS